MSGLPVEDGTGYVAETDRREWDGTRDGRMKGIMELSWRLSSRLTVTSNK